MGVEQCDAGADETVDGAALGVGGRDVLGSAQIKGMVGDDHIDAGVDGLVDDGCHRVNGQQDAAHRLGRISADEPVGVPGSGQAGRCGGLYEGDDITDGQVAFRRAACWSVSGIRGCGCRSVTHATRLAVGRAVPETSKGDGAWRLRVGVPDGTQ